MTEQTQIKTYRPSAKAKADLLESRDIPLRGEFIGSHPAMRAALRTIDSEVAGDFAVSFLAGDGTTLEDAAVSLRKHAYVKDVFRVAPENVRAAVLLRGPVLVLVGEQPVVAVGATDDEGIRVLNADGTVDPITAEALVGDGFLFS